MEEELLSSSMEPLTSSHQVRTSNSSVVLGTSQGPLLVGIHYRLPGSDDSLQDLESAQNGLQLWRCRQVLFLGDFNVDLLKQAASHDILDLFLGYGLHQIIDEPTCVTASSSILIDHVYTSDKALVVSHSVEPPLGTSDQCCVSLHLCSPRQCSVTLRHRVWHYSIANFKGMNELLSLYLPDPESFAYVNEVWSHFHERCVRLSDAREVYPGLRRRSVSCGSVTRHNSERGRWVLLCVGRGTSNHVTRQL